MHDKYDTAGRLIKIYDALGRLTQIAYCSNRSSPGFAGEALRV